MMDLMALFLELVATLVTKPFSLLKLSCIFGVRSICIVIHTWMELLRAAICVHVNIFWRLMVWTIALITLPARVLTALQRERLLEMHLREMQAELEILVWDRKELEERLQMAVKERRLMEMMLAELEEEHDQAFVKIEILESELQVLKDENHQLKEVQGKLLWSSSGQVDPGNGQHTRDADKYGTAHSIPSWLLSYKGSGITLEDLLMHRDAWGDKSKGKIETHDSVKTGSKASGLINPFTPGIVPRYLDVNEVLDQRRLVARSQSLFSATLSLLVGMIIWEAEDPCMPLVVALFTVVGMSLKSVVQFFSTIKNKTASDAVALLSLNWFILGTLTYPTLPRVARSVSPLALSYLEQTVWWLGFSS